MVDLAKKTSITDRLNFNKSFDNSRLSLALPSSSGTRRSPEQQTKAPDEQSLTWSASHPDDNQERERSRFLDKMVVRLDDKLLLVHLREVVWIQSKGNLLCLHLLCADYDCRRTMKDLSMMLDPNCFLRVHRNAIVNLDYIVEFDFPRYGNAFVRLRNGKALPISRTGRVALKRNLFARSYVDGNDDLNSVNRL